VQSQGRLDVLGELVAPTVVNHSAPLGVPSDREGIRQITVLFRTAFPDGRTIVEDMIAEGDRVVTRKTFRGTHQGPFMGIPPTGKQVALGLIDIVRVVQGRVVEHWSEVDSLGLLQRLGALPAGQAAG
jgi:predicted ester cyclase